MKKSKTNEPFYYKGELPEIGAKLVIQVYKEFGLIDVRLIKDDKEIILSTKNLNPEACGITSINRNTNEMRCYDVILNEKMTNTVNGKENQ